MNNYDGKGDRRSRTRRKRIAAALAAALAIAIALSGTYAWLSLDQIAYNEASGAPYPGGRVHDDYDGRNKDVYAENYGTLPLLVRISLREYMETGTGAGIKDTDPGVNSAAPFTAGADINDKATWPAHIPGGDDPADCAIGEADLVHKYIQWTLGGSKVFMPTFNQNREDQSTDASGIALDAVTLGQTAVGRNDAAGDHNDGSPDYWKAGDTVTADEAYWDPDAGAGAGAVAVRADMEHTAKSTLLPEEGGVLTMAQWKAEGCLLGNYWVYETDGWAYWANLLEPGEATSLLLDGIFVAEPDLAWYYCIDVVGQFATVADRSGFDGPPTADAALLIDKAAGLDTDTSS